ncbi:prenyltransferase, partial [Bacteroidales bacterium OttesenSCG-928-A14]|nr:prenyltransferase [Bacteroidales bacterium OttesenSCG-928-A14]
MKGVRFWIGNARYIALPQSILPALVAICYAATFDEFRLLYAIFALFGILAAHLAFNLFDDYFDYKKDSPYIRKQLDAEGFRARLGKCDYITSGETTLRKLLQTAVILLVIALAFGTIIFLKWGMGILYIAGLGGLLGYFYSAPPLSLSYRGLGIFVIVLMFGPLLMCGVLYASCGFVDSTLIYLSIPVGILVANIAYVHDVMDVEPDKKVGKKTLAVLLNNYTAIYVFAAIFNFLPWILIVAGVALEIIPMAYLFALLLLPHSIYLFYM